MDYKLVDDFGKAVIELVRDASIQQEDMVLFKNGSSEFAKKLREKISHMPEETQKVIHMLVPQIVDTTIAYFLLMFEEVPKYKILIEDSGKTTNLLDETDNLTRDFYIWLERFTSERASPNEESL